MNVMKERAKAIREDIARAKSYATKTNYLRALESLASAVGGLVGSQIFGREKFEIQALLDEAVRAVGEMKLIAKMFPAGLTYERGKEKEFKLLLIRLKNKLNEAMEKARITKMRKRLEVLDENLLKAARLVEAEQPLEARKLFRKISEYFQDIEGIDSDIGNRLARMGMFAEGPEYLEKALLANGSDVRAHDALILCYEGLGQTDKAIAAIRECMRRIGTSESLHLRLAKLYLDKRDWNQAYNHASAALEKNPLSSQAQKIMKRTEGKIFAGGKAPTAGGPAAGKPASAGPAAGKPAPGAINLDATTAKPAAKPDDKPAEKPTGKPIIL